MSLAQVDQDGWVPEDSFGARLALVRQHLGAWNVKRTAEHCKIDDQSWRNWEAGSIPRDLRTIVNRIAEATECNPHWLMWGGPLESQNLKQNTGIDRHLRGLPTIEGQLSIDDVLLTERPVLAVVPDLD